jgi:hypothetical protein
MFPYSVLDTGSGAHKKRIAIPGLLAGWPARTTPISQYWCFNSKSLNITLKNTT